MSRLGGRRRKGERYRTYHFDGAEGEEAFTASAVGPGVPARILALLKHILLTLAARLLISHPPTVEGATAPNIHNTHYDDA